MAEKKAQYAWSEQKRSADQIEADMAKKRERLAGTLGELEIKLAPASLSERGKSAVRGYYVGDSGPRWDHIAITVGAVGATIIGIRAFSRSVRWLLGEQRPVKIPSGVVFVPVASGSVGSVGQLEAA